MTRLTNMKLPFRPSINLALWMGLSLVVLSIGTSYSTINLLISKAQQETHTHETAVLLERVVSGFETAESLQRRHLLTNSAQDLAAYQQALAGLQQALRRVHSAQAATDGRQDWHALEGAIAQGIGLMEQAVIARQQAGLDAATAMVGSDLNRQLHNQIDGLVSGIKSSETITLERWKEETRQAAQAVKQLILLGGLLSLGVLAWAILMTSRAQTRQRRIEGELSDSAAMCCAVTERMAEGLMTATQDGVIVNANSAAQQLFGYSLEDLVGRNVATLLPTRYQMGFTAFFGALASRPCGFSESDTRVLGLRRDGTEFPVNASFGDVTMGGSDFSRPLFAT
jgi:PAS domain S-box-containing protein